MVSEIMNFLPIPLTLFEVVYAFVGFMAGLAFGSQCDEDLLKAIEGWDENGKWSKIKKLTSKFFVKALNFIHHAWIGMFGVLYFGFDPISLSIDLPTFIPVFPCAELFWFFLGLATEDLQHHFRASGTDGKLGKLGSFFKTHKKSDSD